MTHSRSVSRSVLHSPARSACSVHVLHHLQQIQNTGGGDESALDQRQSLTLSLSLSLSPSLSQGQALQRTDVRDPGDVSQGCVVMVFVRPLHTAGTPAAGVKAVAAAERVDYGCETVRTVASFRRTNLRSDFGSEASRRRCTGVDLSLDVGRGQSSSHPRSHSHLRLGSHSLGSRLCPCYVVLACRTSVPCPFLSLCPGPVLGFGRGSRGR